MRVSMTDPWSVAPPFRWTSDPARPDVFCQQLDEYVQDPTALVDAVEEWFKMKECIAVNSVQRHGNAYAELEVPMSTSRE